MAQKQTEKINKEELRRGKLMLDNGKFYGTTTVGQRGQVVIPADARKELNLRPGDQLIVLGRTGKVIALVKSEQFSEFIQQIMEHNNINKFISKIPK